MNELITLWMTRLGLPEQYLALAIQMSGVIILTLVCFISFYLAKHQLLQVIKKIIDASDNKHDDLLLEYNVFSRMAMLIPFIVILLLAPYLLVAESLSLHIATVIAKIGLVFQVSRTLSALLNVVKSLALKITNERYLPINATIQVLKLLVYLVCSILIISYLLNRSPFYLLSGIGAVMAVLLLVFQDTIKGLVASIQISANKMVAPGDWIEMPKYGADGDVIEIALNTVKVKNWDNTISTIPTYALISESFKNWRGMMNSSGRRIKRAITFNINSIHFCSQEEIAAFKKIALIKDYMEQKLQLIEQENQQRGIANNDFLNARQLTNIGTFRAYIDAYLAQHSKIEHSLTCMVRQLPATPTGLSLELYCFSNDKVWVNYERIQADIFDHLFAMAPHFNLRVFQHPSGSDFNHSNIKYSSASVLE
jgi:miniconductance mechanosensitive channel